MSTVNELIGYCEIWPEHSFKNWGAEILATLNSRIKQYTQLTQSCEKLSSLSSGICEYFTYDRD